MASIRIGISGWRYEPWRKIFYPADLAQHRELEFASRAFASIEINGSFYSLQTPQSYESWYRATPADFVFSVKGPRYVTHILRLKNASDATELFLKMIDPLRAARRLGPILFQLPPAMKCDVALLRSYLELLPADLRYAFEFRHASWLVEEVYDALRQRNVSLCVAESERLEVPQVITADFVYYRLRKPEYTPEDVDAIVARSKEVLATGRDLYLMFKHEESPEGALNAETVLKNSR